MAKHSDSDELIELTRTLLITQLGLAGVPQRNIRVLAKCDMNRVAKVVKFLKPNPKGKRKR